MSGSVTPVIGHDPNGHPHVDEDLEHEHSRYPPSDQRAEQILRHHQDAQRPPDQQRVEQQHHPAPEEAVLLADGREHEVGVVLGHVVAA